MAINYYPQCPQPELTYGLPGHTDPNALTVLLQDEVPGLQVMRNGRWVAVNPIPDTFVVNIGDQIQVSVKSCKRNSRKLHVTHPSYFTLATRGLELWMIKKSWKFICERNPSFHSSQSGVSGTISFLSHLLKIIVVTVWWSSDPTCQPKLNTARLFWVLVDHFASEFRFGWAWTWCFSGQPDLNPTRPIASPNWLSLICLIFCYAGTKQWALQECASQGCGE